MSKARNLADVISGAFDVPAGALDNAPTPTLSSLGIANHNNISVDSSGRMTNSSQPNFVAHITGTGAYTSVAEGSPAPFNDAIFNVGSCFNTATYRFVAPVAGNYLFSASVITNADFSHRPCFYINGGSNRTNSFQHIVSHGNIIVAIVPLSANDYVDVRSQGGALNYFGAAHSQFSGILIS